jgi:predicted phage terminase large subunit-like protein
LYNGLVPETNGLERQTAAAARTRARIYGSGVPSYSEWLKYRGKRGLDFTYPHVKKIVERVESLVSGASQFEFVVCPPRHGKTEAGTKHPALYVMEKEPGTRVMLLAHNLEYAQELSRQIRDMAAEHGLLGSDAASVGYWRLKNGSSLRCFGAGQGIHGYNADWIFIDDPIGDSKDNNSQTFRENVWSWFMENVLLRRMAHTRMMFIYTNGHYDDLGQRALKIQDIPWNVLRMPCESEGDGSKPGTKPDPLGRPEGEFLCYELFSREWYEATKRIFLSTEPHVWWGHFQCRPSAKEGYSFKPDNIEIIEPDALREYALEKKSRSWDNAAASSTKGDESVGARGGKWEDCLIVDDLIHERWNPGARDASIASTAAADGTDVHVTIPCDPGEAGVRTQENMRPLLSGYSYTFIRPVGSKVFRADPLASAVNRGKVKFVKAPWNEHVIEQMRQFPLGAHDDCIDALSDLWKTVMLDPDYRFRFTGDHVYTSQMFEASFENASGGSYLERDLLEDKDLFARWGAFAFGTSSQEPSWLLFFALGCDGIRYIYDSVEIVGRPVEEQARDMKKLSQGWLWDPKPVYCEEKLSGQDADGMSRWTKFSRAGFPMFMAPSEDPVEGWSTVESLLAKRIDGFPALMVHERNKSLIAYLSTTPRDPTKRGDIDPRWIGRKALDAVRLGCHTHARAPKGRANPLAGIWAAR